MSNELSVITICLARRYFYRNLWANEHFLLVNEKWTFFCFDATLDVLPEAQPTFFCCRRSINSIKALLCKTQYFCAAKNDALLTTHTHCIVVFPLQNGCANSPQLCIVRTAHCLSCSSPEYFRSPYLTNPYFSFKMFCVPTSYACQHLNPICSEKGYKR
jgi:hypothetical protein